MACVADHRKITINPSILKMSKSILVLGIFFIASALAQSKCPGECRINVRSTSVCIVQQDPAQCLKIKECTLNEMNCVRKRQNIPLLSKSKIERCSLIRGATGSGRCSVVNKCQSMKCVNDKVVRCQQAGKQCRLLTNCAARKENCNRPPNNQMKSVGMAACKGFKRTEGFKPCKPAKKKKKKKSSRIKKILKG